MTESNYMAVTADPFAVFFMGIFPYFPKEEINHGR